MMGRDKYEKNADGDMVCNNKKMRSIPISNNKKKDN